MALEDNLYHIEEEKKLIDGRGDPVGLLYPHFSVLYIDNIARDLSKRYNLAHENVGNLVHGSLGKSEREKFVAYLLKICKSQGSLVGFLKGELEKYLGKTAPLFFKLLEGGCLRTEVIGDREVIFPTRKLLKNQKVPKMK